MLENGKKVVFVGVPMAGKYDALIKRSIRVTKQAYLKEKGLDIKDVAFIDNFDKNDKVISFGGNKSVRYLGRAIKRLAVADEAVFGEGWHVSRECILETEVCMYYGIPVNVIYNCKEGEFKFKEDETDAYITEHASNADKEVYKIFVG